jgi:cytochrome c556
MLKPLAVVLSLALLSTATAETPDATSDGVSTPAARAAIANRRAIFTLIGNNFRPVGEVLRTGTVTGQIDPQKYARRVALLAGFLPDAFPPISGSGDTRARQEIWSDHAQFDRLLQEFQLHAGQLAQVDFTHDATGFRAAAATVAQDCKSCHQRYRSE